MLCQRCLIAVEDQLNALGFNHFNVSLGEISYFPNGEPDLVQLEAKLSAAGFRMLEDRKAEITQKVEDLVHEVYSGDFDFPDQFRFADLARKRLGKEYEAISDSFIEVKRKSIERYILEFRIGKVKEFLVYQNLTLADIAFRLNFNSPSHLSSQFKQFTGLTPSYFRGMGTRKASSAFVSN